MHWAKGRVYAGGVVVLFLAGCVLPEFFRGDFFQSSAAGHERVIGGSVESVSKSTQGVLRQLGLSAVVTKQGSDVRIVSETNGMHFCVVLISEKSSRGESTRVHIEWENAQDDQMGFQILSMLELQGQG